MSANILAVLLVFGCGLIHLVTGQCIVVKKSEEKVEEAKSDVWLPNLFHGKINVVYFLNFFLFFLFFCFSRKQIIRYKRFRFEWGKNLNSRISRLHNVCMVLSFCQYEMNVYIPYILFCKPLVYVLILFICYNGTFRALTERSEKMQMMFRTIVLRK